MANFLMNNAFRIAVSTLNFVSPSIVADILLHPFDFATVLLQIGFDPEGTKSRTATIFSVIVQYALFTFYIPYLLTSMQGLQFMGMPHPSIFYYVNYIYRKEGLLGCYRGLVPKIFERLIMVGVNERIKRRMNKASIETSSDFEMESDQEKFVRNLLNTVCSQFFAVLVSHPFHVLMVSSFAEFACDRKSSIVQLSRAIYSDEGYFGFFTGLTARLLGELLSLIFSVTYTAIINQQLRPQQPVLSVEGESTAGRATHFVNYVTDISRFTVFKQPRSVRMDETGSEEPEERSPETGNRITQIRPILFNFLRSLTHHSLHRSDRSVIPSGRPCPGACPLVAYIPLTSKLFYYILIRDFLSKKISNPFFMVCHCSIVLDTGWDKFPLLTYLDPMVLLIQKQEKTHGSHPSGMWNEAPLSRHSDCAANLTSLNGSKNSFT